VVTFIHAWLALFAWAAVTFMVLERLVPRVRARVPWRRIVIAGGLLGAGAWIGEQLSWVPPEPGHVMAVAAGWVIAELIAYWIHRAMHRVPWLWRFHRVHHEDVPLAWPTAWYAHPIDSALFSAAMLVGAVATGGGVPTAGWFVVGRRAWTVALHANIAWPASRLDGVIATPPFHHRHHREDLPPANFASTLPVFDRLFGTFRPADRS
jgi:sterol desaturase/sphingolipid hydroxylase (fatty acid hydroxylase superfamily)